MIKVAAINQMNVSGAKTVVLQCGSSDHCLVDSVGMSKAGPPDYAAALCGRSVTANVKPLHQREPFVIVGVCK